MNKIILNYVFLTILFNLFCVVVMADTLPQNASIDWHSTDSYSDWINVKSLGAKGDGIHDDTVAIQGALDKLSDNAKPGSFSTVYFPPGIYNISSTLNLSNKKGVSLIGSGSATVLAWVGPIGGIMYNSNGVRQCRYLGLSWDGRNKAAVGVDHRSQKFFETRIRHEQEIFENFTDTGLRVGFHQKLATAEVFFLNDIFFNNGIGVAFLYFNDLDNKFLRTEFIKNRIGIKNYHGNFDISETNFYKNSIADVSSSILAGQLRSVTSQGSGQFIVMPYSTATGELVVQDCRVSDWTNLEHGAINLSVRNTSMIFDCAFSNSNIKARSPIQLTNGPWSTQLLTISNVNWSSGIGTPLVNTFSSNFNLVKIPGSIPLNKLSNSFVNSTYFTPTRVFDARSFGARGNDINDDTKAVQNTIDAAMDAGDGAAAYFPIGNYKISKQIKIIKGRNVNILGSGFDTTFVWTGGETTSSMFYVLDGDNVKIERFRIRTNDPKRGVVDTSEDGVCRITQALSQPDTVSSTVYDGINVGGSFLAPSTPKDKIPNRFICGLLLSGLSEGSQVHVINFDGPIHAENSSQAKIFVDVSYNGVIDVSGTSEPKSGYFNIVSREGEGSYFDQIVEDNQNLTIGYDYSESSFSLLHLLGSSISRSVGHVTIVYAKAQSIAPYQIEIDGYNGRVSILSGHFVNGPTYNLTVPIISVSQSKIESALDLLFMGITFWSKPTFDLNKESSLTLLQNQIINTSNKEDHKLLLPNTALGSTLIRANAALNDLRNLARHALNQKGY